MDKGIIYGAVLSVKDKILPLGVLANKIRLKFREGNE